jgi:hypothetical protein
MAAFPSLIGRTAGSFYNECLANHPRPQDVMVVLTAALVGGGMDARHAALWIAYGGR